jgi:hypothetical protein
MQSETDKNLEGVISLAKLQLGEYKLWTKDEIAGLDLNDISKLTLYFIAEENNWRRIPSTTCIKKRFHFSGDCTILYTLRDKRLIFNVTVADIIKFYGVDFLGCRYRRFNPPSRLEWLHQYLDDIKGSGGNGGSVLSLKNKLEFSRSPTYPRHYIALMEICGKPCYYPLGLHIPVGLYI